MNSHWFFIINRPDTDDYAYWFFALLINLVINFAVWALFLWMAASIVKGVFFQ